MAGLRIIGGQWRGKSLSAAEGLTTRPTNVRARQAIFDILLHASWAGTDFIRDARVLDVFAGTGAFGLEALSRGAKAATFVENQPAALAALRANIAQCKAQQAATILAANALIPPPGDTHDLVFLDPPYAQNLVPAALSALASSGYFSPNAVFVAELGPTDDFTPPNPLSVRRHGKARIFFWSQRQR